ncbi:hypothetical protein [Leptospira meyeri]|uniref:hypothetical protein n=1 Tax=Leptospira meyeri TaxID=29508 RepID=UPI00223D5B9F|nr:hypothetical protein [Leptospira meyeri]MCW7488853.1 hypothetical protein [Leptospira meyeri]
MKKVTVCLLLLLIGCATFTDYNPEYKEVIFEEKQNRNSSVVLNLRYQMSLNETPADANVRVEKDLRNEIEVILKESSMFKEVKSGLDIADIKLDVDIVNRGEANLFLSFMTGFTFFLLPSHAVDNLTLKYKFTTNKGKIVKEYKRQVTYDTWVHITLIPFTPFMFPFTTFYSGIRNVTRSVLVEAKTDGIIN